MTIARTLSLVGIALALWPAAQALAALPSFSCAKPAGAAEKAVCTDETLAGLDRETARLYGLARKLPTLSAPQKNQHTAMQRGWIKGRDDCWKATDAKACIRDAYVIRIAELRADLVKSGNKDKGGLTLGPVSVNCPGVAPMRATFVNVEPSLAYLAGGDQSLVLTIAPSGSGARYTAQSPGGEASFWQKGPEAMVQLPGGKEQACAVGPFG